MIEDLGRHHRSRDALFLLETGKKDVLPLHQEILDQDTPTSLIIVHEGEVARQYLDALTISHDHNRPAHLADHLRPSTLIVSLKLTHGRALQHIEIIVQ